MQKFTRLFYAFRSMPKESRAQIQREYRQRHDADAERRQRYLKTEHKKYVKDLLAGKRKHVADIQNERELRKMRREWKKDRGFPDIVQKCKVKRWLGCIKKIKVEELSCLDYNFVLFP